MKLDKINSTYKSITYTNLEKQPAKNNTPENKSVTERPKNAQAKALGAGLARTTLLCLALIFTGNRILKVKNPLMDALLCSTLYGLVDISCAPQNKYKLDTEEKLNNMSVITGLGFASIYGAKKLKPNSLGKNAIDYNKYLAIVALSSMVGLGVKEALSKKREEKLLTGTNNMIQKDVNIVA